MSDWTQAEPGERQGLIFEIGRNSRSRCTHMYLPPATAVRYEPRAWEQTLVMVQTGLLRVTCQSGREAYFEPGEILHLADLPLSSIGSAGEEPLILLCLSPRPPITGDPDEISPFPTP